VFDACLARAFVKGPVPRIIIRTVVFLSNGVVNTVKGCQIAEIFGTQMRAYCAGALANVDIASVEASKHSSVTSPSHSGMGAAFINLTPPYQ